MLCFFTSDLHGKIDRYRTLLARIRAERPAAVFLGGDLLPMPMDFSWADGSSHDFVQDYLIPEFKRLAFELDSARPRIFLIMGNDDAAANEPDFKQAEMAGAWTYIHKRRVSWNGHDVYGYACVPPTPFQLKDWERYDVSRHLDPGCVSPEAGNRSVAIPKNSIRYGTILKDLKELVGSDSLDKAIFLFHSPPYNCLLDRADLDGQFIDHVPLDVHIGSIAIQRIIEARQPMLTLHGHVHESTRLTGTWREQFGRTHGFQAAHDGPELSLIRFDPGNLADADRELI
jgi:Icc-related predicted phosphoesterase